jgi:hypothetical protein
MMASPPEDRFEMEAGARRILASLTLSFAPADLQFDDYHMQVPYAEIDSVSAEKCSNRSMDDVASEIQQQCHHRAVHDSVLVVEKGAFQEESIPLVGQCDRFIPRFVLFRFNFSDIDYDWNIRKQTSEDARPGRKQRQIIK